ncbi:MAG: metallophosphoesterase family protein [Candidatus Hodarchaeales archaeon]|jgi:putative phosphoesterase
MLSRKLSQRFDDMRFAVISDIHSNLPALREVFKDIFELEINHIICLGDIIGYGPFPLECIDSLLKAKNMSSLYVLKGNHDHYLVHGLLEQDRVIDEAKRAIDWTNSLVQEKGGQLKMFLDTLPESLTLKVGIYHFHLVHGSPEQPLDEYVFKDSLGYASTVMYLQETGYDLCLMGHTHIPYFEIIDDPIKTRYVGNPGSVGQPRDKSPKASYMVLDISKDGVNGEIRRIEYDIDMVQAKIREVGLPEMLAERLSFGV